VWGGGNKEEGQKPASLDVIRTRFKDVKNWSREDLPYGEVTEKISGGEKTPSYIGELNQRKRRNKEGGGTKIRAVSTKMKESRGGNQKGRWCKNRDLGRNLRRQPDDGIKRDRGQQGTVHPIRWTFNAVRYPECLFKTGGREKEL